jgi:hypothetical protein
MIRIRFEWVVVLFATVTVHASQPATRPSSACQAGIRAFLRTPTQRTLKELSALDKGECWTTVGSSNSVLDRLNHEVRQGNRWAAEYLAKHHSKLGGGNLEDALIALGEFSEHDMKRVLFFANQGLLSKQELTDAMTMLPLSLADNPQAQLQKLKVRREKAERVTVRELSPQKARALRAIDDFASEVRSKNPGHEL